MFYCTVCRHAVKDMDVYDHQHKENQMDETFEARLARIMGDVGLPSNFHVKLGTEALPEVTDEEIDEALEVWRRQMEPTDVILLAPEWREFNRNSIKEALKAARRVQQPRYYFQIKCWRPDAIDGHMDWGYSGKYTISPHATDSELVQAIFGLFKGYQEHEAREFFQYAGRRVFGPHINIDAQWEAANKIEVRSAMHTVDKEEG